ncbi:uracil-DNA glycosylase family protein [Oecophyllibacter saccharovorans]|uniref:uracil-DNA glycosylase family protein n=1 Tax=Oecophyllibacter saccharovorans TaxID=2558360 RepID=UPI00116EC279|nr:uracil-DNA glycosylase family protein [Oecophyllibacter saccharovorans]TPW36332.1 uracil-DNA glycosylase family protein [Oecophyllibacter saccharovorans]
MTTPTVSRGREGHETFDSVVARLRQCRLCRDNPRKGSQPLPHEPRPIIHASPTARICIVGQAPGIRAHDTQRSFNDPSGVRLRSWLGMDDATFYDRRKVALIPMGFCFPGYDANKSDLPPRRECAEAWRAQLFAQMPDIRLMVILGTYAQRWHLGSKVAREGVNNVVSRWHDFYEAEGGLKRFVLPHPSWRNNAWLKRNPWFEADVLPVLKRDVRETLAGFPQD